MENFTAIQDTEQFYNETGSESLYVASDSSAYDYNLEIWPKGRFSYSPEKGFEGEAEKVKISKTGATETLLKKELAEVTQEAVLKKSDRLENNLLKSNYTAEEKTTVLSWKWVTGIGLFLMVAALGWYLRR